MPYRPEHREETRARIVECARVLFNRHGFHGVSIDQIMAEAGLTRGGFYNHFKDKEALHSAAVQSFLMGRGAQWREETGVDISNLTPKMAVQMIGAYLSPEHLGDLDGQCPMIALPSDVARAGKETQLAFEELLVAMVWLLENAANDDRDDTRTNSLAAVALCVGGMVLARTLPNCALADEVRSAAYKNAVSFIGCANDEPIADETQPKQSENSKPSS